MYKACRRIPNTHGQMSVVFTVITLLWFTFVVNLWLRCLEVKILLLVNFINIGSLIFSSDKYVYVTYIGVSMYM